jgi:hypothetical protein
MHSPSPNDDLRAPLLGRTSAKVQNVANSTAGAQMIDAIGRRDQAVGSRGVPAETIKRVSESEPPEMARRLGCVLRAQSGVWSAGSA